MLFPSRDALGAACAINRRTSALGWWGCPTPHLVRRLRYSRFPHLNWYRTKRTCSVLVVLEGPSRRLRAELGPQHAAGEQLCVFQRGRARLRAAPHGGGGRRLRQHAPALCKLEAGTLRQPHRPLPPSARPPPPPCPPNFVRYPPAPRSACATGGASERNPWPS